MSEMVEWLQIAVNDLPDEDKVIMVCPIPVSSDLRNPEHVVTLPGSSDGVGISITPITSMGALVSLHTPQWRGPACTTLVIKGHREYTVGTTNLRVFWFPDDATVMMDADLADMFARFSGLLTGEPRFRGTRLGVRHIGEMSLRGADDEIHQDYPYLTSHDLHLAREFVKGSKVWYR